MAAHQAPPSLGFSRQEYWSGLPFPSPMHLAMPNVTVGPVLVQLGRGTFAAALLVAMARKRPKVAAAGVWIAAASIATVANAIRVTFGGPPSDFLVSDAARHA